MDSYEPVMCSCISDRAAIVKSESTPSVQSDERIQQSGGFRGSTMYILYYLLKFELYFL